MTIDSTSSSTSTPQGMESMICCRAARMRSFSARLLVRAALRSGQFDAEMRDFLLQIAI